MALVLDASVVLAWFLPDENHPDADAALEEFDVDVDGALVPALWWFELRNTLLVCERRSRIDRMQTGRILLDVAQLRVVIDRDPGEAFLLDLARRHRLTAYDAAYLELAIRKRTVLATLDTRLREAARGEGVALLTA